MDKEVWQEVKDPTTPTGCIAITALRLVVMVVPFLILCIAIIKGCNQ